MPRQTDQGGMVLKAGTTSFRPQRVRPEPRYRGPLWSRIKTNEDPKPRLQRLHRTVRRPGKGRCDRPDYGDAHGAAECRFHRLTHVDQRGHDLRDCGGGGQLGASRAAVPRKRMKKRTTEAAEAAEAPDGGARGAPRCRQPSIRLPCTLPIPSPKRADPPSTSAAKVEIAS
jgi:hypothetical protein